MYAQAHILVRLSIEVILVSVRRVFEGLLRARLQKISRFISAICTLSLFSAIVAQQNSESVVVCPVYVLQEDFLTLLYEPEIFYALNPLISLPECDASGEPTERCFGCVRYQGLPTVLFECSHPAPRNRENPNHDLPPCRENCIITYLGNLLMCNFSSRGTVERCDAGRDPNPNSAWALQRLRFNLRCPSQVRERRWEEYTRFKVGCGAWVDFRIMWRCIHENQNYRDHPCNTGGELEKPVYRRPGFKCCSEGGQPPRTGEPEFTGVEETQQIR